MHVKIYRLSILIVTIQPLSVSPTERGYPVFWQWFLWVFGGFVLNDYKEKDYELLSTKTGIPIAEIPRALESYQHLFPRSDGWFMEPSNVNVRMLKLFPVPFMGVGANYRPLMFAADKKMGRLSIDWSSYT